MDTEPTGPGLPDPGPSDPAPLDDLDREILAASATLTTGSAADAGEAILGLLRHPAEVLIAALWAHVLVNSDDDLTPSYEERLRHAGAAAPIAMIVQAVHANDLQALRRLSGDTYEGLVAYLLGSVHALTE